MNNGNPETLELNTDEGRRTVIRAADAKDAADDGHLAATWRFALEIFQ